MIEVQPVFSVVSVRRSVAWYRDVLGLEPTYLNEARGKPDTLNYAVLRKETVGVHLGLAGDMNLPAGCGACSFTVTDFDEIYARTQAVGAELYLELGCIPNGARTFGVKDPDGNLLAFIDAD